MIEQMWELLKTFTDEFHQAALSKCIELDLDQNSGVVSLNESYINLGWASTILKDAIEQRKLIQLPITIQKDLLSSLDAISKYQTELIAGTGTIVSFSGAVEKLNTSIWQYNLHHLSGDVLGYQAKLNQLKDIERAAIEAKNELQEGIKVKKSLEEILEKSHEQSDLLQTQVTNAITAVATTNDALTQTQDSSIKAAALLTTIQNNEMTSTQELGLTVASKEKVMADEVIIKNLVSGFTSLTGDLAANKITQQELFDKFGSYEKRISGLLGDASRTGMAASFTNRKRMLLFPMSLWILIFVGSISGLVYMGVTYLAPFLDSGKLEQLPSRLALTAPFIWLGWFAAKQYGYTTRLREDYAYKEASAIAFEGYKREAGSVSEVMLQNLMETSIKNLGDNPIRVYSGGENHASPVQEILENLLKEEKPSDFLKKLLTKDKGKE